MKINVSNCTCPKCQGTGKIDFSELDNGTCFKCNGNGYLGEMPQGWVKKLDSKKFRNAALEIVRYAVNTLISKNILSYGTGYETYSYTIENLIKVGFGIMKFKKVGIWENAPNMEFVFGGESGEDSEYRYKCIVSEKIEIHCFKNLSN
jgi:hypothetical protein